MKERIILTEIFRMSELMGLNFNNLDKKRLIKETVLGGGGIVDDLIELLTKKSYDDITALGFKNADDMYNLAKNFPTSSVDDQATILKTILSNANEQIFKNIAKQIINDTSSIVGSQVKAVIDDYSELMSKYPNIKPDEWADKITKDLSQKFRGSQIPNLTDAITIEAAERIRLLKKTQGINTGTINNSNLNGILTQTEENNINYLLDFKQTSFTIDNSKYLSKELDDTIKKLKNTIDTYPNKDKLPKEIYQKYKDLNAKKFEVDEFIKKNNINVPDPQSYLKGVSEEQLLSKLNNNGKINSRGWYEFGPDFRPEEMSGWKFHIFGETLEDSAFLIERLRPIAEKYNASSKVGGLVQVNSPGMKPGTNQYGKQGVTMYIPNSVINGGKQQEMLADIQSVILGYKKGGNIIGDQSITPAIHYRYELMGPIPKNGIDNTTYSKMYSANQGGSYKPSDVNDIFNSN